MIYFSLEKKKKCGKLEVFSVIGRTILKVRWMWIVEMTVTGWLDFLQVNFTKNSIVNAALDFEIRMHSFVISSFQNNENLYIICITKGTDSTWRHGNEGVCLQKAPGYDFMKCFSVYPWVNAWKYDT